LQYWYDFGMEKETTLPLVNFGKVVTAHATPGAPNGAPPIIFIHGMAGGKYQFSNWQRYCAERGWESYAVDLRGHHDSVADNFRKVSIADYASDVKQVIAAVGPCYLVGHSMGGLVVQLVASQTPDVKGAVLVATSPPGGVIGINWFIISMLRYLPQMIVGKPLLISSKDMHRFVTNRLDPSSYKHLVPESQRAGRNIIFQKFRVDKLLCPALVITGACDRAVPRSIGPTLARKYDADFIEIPEMAHMLPMEPEWEQPIAAILTWIEKTRSH
jgi:pimeloyl-ACP methyl ester carboxylesterase